MPSGISLLFCTDCGSNHFQMSVIFRASCIFLPLLFGGNRLFVYLCNRNKKVTTTLFFIIMKRNTKTAVAYIVIAIVTMFTSCSGVSTNDITDGNSSANTVVEKEEATDEPGVDGSDVEITDSVSYTISEMADKIFGSGISIFGSDIEQYRQQFLDKAEAEEKELQEEYGTEEGLTYKSITYKYMSTDISGKPIELSGEVSWRRFAGKPVSPENIILCEHFTITEDFMAPSNFINFMQFVVGNALLIQPDYIGYGATKNELHPFLNHEVIAVNSVDALEAGYQAWKKDTGNEKSLLQDWKMVVIGSSQGGSNALAVHKYMDTHPDVADKWHFAYSYCCCGPYSPSATMEGYYKNGSASYPCILPMTIKSMIASYPEILGKYKEEDFYSEKYLKIKNTMDNMFASKKFGALAINNTMRTALGSKSKSVPLKDVLSETFLDMNSQIAQDFFKCLEKNDLTTGWTPVHEIQLYQTKIDEVVPYANAEKLKQAFPDKVKEVKVLEETGHLAACVFWTFLELPEKKW